MLVKDEPEVKEEVEEEEDLEPPAVTPIPEPEIVDAAEVPPVVEEIETKPQPKTCDESLVPASGISDALVEIRSLLTACNVCYAYSITLLHYLNVTA